MRLGKILHKLTFLKPILKIIGVKEKTVISKGVEVIEVLDKAVNEKATKD